MNEKQLYEWAIKGLKAEIDELERDISKGKRFLADYENGLKPKTTKTQYEIHAIIRQKKAEIEKLDKERFNLEWKLNTEMQ